MGLEAGTYINSLVPTNPVGATDPKSQGDDHLRLLKATIQASFPNITGAMIRTQAELNAVGASGITGFAVPANTVKVTGAAAGAATTAIRSDAVLVVDLAIVPTWTGAHVWNNADATVQGTGRFIGTNTGQNFISVTGGIGVNYSLDILGAAGVAARLIARFGHSGISNGVTVSSNGVAVVLANNGNLVPDVSSAPTWTGAHVFQAAGAPRFASTGTSEDIHLGGPGAGTNTPFIGAYTIANVLRGSIDFAADITITNVGGGINLVGTGAVQYNGVEIGYRGLPASSNPAGSYALAATDNGKVLVYIGTGGHTFSCPNTVTDQNTIILNAGSAPLALTGATTLNWFNGAATPVGARTLAVGGVANVLHRGGGNWYVWGTGIS